MTFLSELKQQFDAEDNTFLMTIRDEILLELGSILFTQLLNVSSC